MAKVDGIREEALALGWTMAQLYQNRGSVMFQCGQDYGLVCFLKDDSELGRVTRDFVEIRGKVLKYIKNTYLKQVNAPLGVNPSLKAWMELNEGQ